MGKALIIYRATPRYMEKLDETIKEIEGIKSGEVVDIKKEPIGFGVTVLKVGVMVKDKEANAVEKVTEELNSLPLVEEAEQQEMTLI